MASPAPAIYTLTKMNAAGVIAVQDALAQRRDSSACAIALVGLWHLGSVSAAAWTGSGHRVLAWDPDPELCAEIAAGRGPVSEPGVDAALSAAVLAGALTVVDNAEAAIARARVTHLAYDTQLGSSNRIDDPRLDLAVNTFAAAAPPGALLLVSSQIPVGTCQRWEKLLEAKERGLVVAHVPENLRLGSALNDFHNPPRLLIGADRDEAYERTAELFSPFSRQPIRLRLASAEMAKHATNAYLALCIAFANDLAWLSLATGADPMEVTEALRADPRVSPSAPLRPGTAFSGATLIRDVTALRMLGEDYDRAELFAAVIKTNERHATLAVTWLREALGSLDGACVAVAGLTYKPGTSTLRDSLPLRVIAELLESGATVKAWDPWADAFEPPPGLTRTTSLEECVCETDALAVLTALSELAAVDWAALEPERRLVVDVCGAVDRAAAETGGWSYRGFSVGRSPSATTS